ncbi:MAG: hypothetical protein U5K30_17795 [Acidimicrobiales bacterium]|nr:hypothetical protein [Acidimicrobiales bacterium]
MQRTWSRRRFIAAAGSALVGGGLLAACGDDDGDPAAQTVPSTTTTSEPTPLPTNDEDELKEMFEPLFEPIGQRVTRIGLYDLSQGFVRDDEGDHLAIYTDPIDPAGEGWDAERYIAACVDGVRASTPFIFDTWPGIATMDVCQEPPQEEAPEPEPPIVTQVQMSRADYNLIDSWDDLTLTDLMVAKDRSPMTVRVRANDEVAAHPQWVEAQDAASSAFGN